MRAGRVSGGGGGGVFQLSHQSFWAKHWSERIKPEEERYAKKYDKKSHAKKSQNRKDMQRNMTRKATPRRAMQRNMPSMALVWWLAMAILSQFPLITQAKPAVFAFNPKVGIERLSLSTERITSQEDFFLQVSLYNRGPQSLQVWILAQLESRPDHGAKTILKPHWKKVQLPPSFNRNLFLPLATPSRSGFWQVRVNLFGPEQKQSLLPASYTLPFSSSYGGIEEISSEMALSEKTFSPTINLVLPDLAWEAIQVIPTKTNQFHLRGLLINQGGSPAKHIVLHGIYATPDNSNKLQSLETPVLINLLSPGEQIWVDIKDEFPPQAKNPTRIGIQADPKNLIPEAQEDNNDVYASPFVFR